jgi:hypothetical protein
MYNTNKLNIKIFPDIYGVLNCHTDDATKTYVLYEAYDNNITHLIKNIEHTSEWYDICFQFAYINYQMKHILKHPYNSNLKNHIYKSVTNSFLKHYTINEIEFNIRHKHLIVIWDIETENTTESNIERLYNYIKNNDDIIKIKPSPKLIDMLQELIDNDDNTPKILKKYYVS